MPGKGTTDAMFALGMSIEKDQGISKRATLCIRRSRESLRQGSKRRSVVVLYEKIRNGGKICATCTGYV